jgi:hypothetical protein
MTNAYRNKDSEPADYFFSIPLIRSFFFLVSREFPLFQITSADLYSTEIPKR